VPKRCLARLQQYFRQSIESALDLDQYHHEGEQEKNDWQELAELRQRVNGSLAGQNGPEGGAS
jgi:hypothetical protein